MNFGVLKKFKKKLNHFKIWWKIYWYQSNYQSKIFCIGYNKTGTTTVGKAIQALGFKHSTFEYKVWREWYQKGRIDKVIKYTAKFDSFDDLPWLLEDMIPILDKNFPESKFIYLERDEEAWKKSFYEWTKWRKGFYPDMKESLKDFQAHKNFVLEYFKDFPDDRFIILNVVDPLGFKKLANFLGKDAPQDAFSHFNKTSDLLKK